MVGEPPQNGLLPENICGMEDNRVASNNAAVGRIVPVGCSGWIVNNGLQATAGHCFTTSSAEVLEFNVPPSLPDGTIQHPAPQHQYSIVPSSIVYISSGIGNDWGIFQVFDNSNTGLQPIEAQGASFTAVQDLIPPTLRVTGYGVDGPPPDFGNPPPRNSDSQTQQAHVGPESGSSGTTLKYRVDCQPGNSGSPVIAEPSGYAIGVHTHGGCTSGGGNNNGTSTLNTGFWNALRLTTVLVDQKLENGISSVDSVGRWEAFQFNNYAVPGAFDFTIGGTEVLRGSPKIISAQKYYRWNDPADVTNHHRFQIALTTNQLISNFKSTYSSVTLKNNLFSAPIGYEQNGKIEFKDPWLVKEGDADYYDSPYGYRNLGLDAVFEENDSPFNPNTNPSGPGSEYKGVFLNQHPNVTPVYYSIQASTHNVTVNGKSITYDWESWSYDPNKAELTNPNSGTTPVVFLDDNAVITANLKGRRTSDIPEATANNNGRKITYHWADASTRKPYLVYEDRGNIYSASQNALGQWQKDGRIAAATANLLNQTPALAYLHEISGSREDKRVIAWAEYDLSEDNYLVQSNLAGFPEPDWQMPDPPHPAVSGYRLHQPAASTTVVAFHGSGALPLEGLDNGVWLWFTRDGALYQVSPWYFVAWQEAAGIQYRRFYRRNDAGSEVTVDQNVLLNQGYFGLSSHERPSLAAVTHGANDNVDVFVAWQALASNDTEENVPFPRGIETDPCTLPALEKRVVCFRENRSGWQPLNIFTIDNTCNRNPVVTAWNAGNPRDCVIIYEKGGGEVDYLYRESGEWHPAEALTTDGNHPSLSSLRFGDSDVPHAVWSEHAAAPYRVQHGEISLTPVESLAGRGQASLPHSRRIYFRLKEALAGGNQLPIDGEVTFEIADPQWITAGSAQPVKPLYRDSLITPENAFRFNAINVSQPGERLTVPVQIVGRNLKRVSPTGSNLFSLPLLRLRLKDENTGQVLQTVHTFQSSILGNDSTRYIAIADTFEIELSAFVSRRIQVEGATFFNLNDPGKGGPQIAEVYDLREETLQPRLAGKVPAPANAGVPGQFALSQNYPNPFNPATNIEFQLPQASHVTLKIYDLQGRLVKTLTNGEFSAGTHRVEWDGRDEHGNGAASGIYLYHIKAGNYVETRKMVLMR